jgi:sporulation protein YlmC with PRC-barrel domain
VRLSELLGSEVVDRDGASLGHVHDVRAVQDGPAVAGFGALLRVDGLVVGRGSKGVRLGFHRSGVKGPWPLKRIFETLERQAVFVPWHQVEAWEGPTIRISARGADLSDPPPLQR